jgi:hypothetical protein
VAWIAAAGAAVQRRDHGRDWPFLRKPYLASELAEALERLHGPGSDDHFERRMLPTG